MSRRDNKSAAAAPAVHVEKQPDRFVTVACKIPTGLILQCHTKVKFWEDTPSGAKERVRYDKAGPRFFAAGPARPKGYDPELYAAISGGYGLTPQIPAKFWEQWLEENKDAPYVVNGQVFAMTTYDAARGEAGENADVKSGFEPLNQDMDWRKDDRLPKPMPGSALSAVAKPDEKAGAVGPADEMAGRAAA